MQIFIGGNQEGLQNTYKPFLLPTGAYPNLVNAYTRDQRTRKKRGHTAQGRLSRALTALAQSNTTGAPSYSTPDLINSVRGTEPNAEIKPGTITLRIDPGGGSQTVYTDNGTGGWTFVSGPFSIDSTSTINYSTGAVSLSFTGTPPGGLTVNADLTYYPLLPVMGIIVRELPQINSEDTIAFDTRYAYQPIPTGWVEFGPAGTTWTGSDSQLFWGANYRGTNPQAQALWVTNNNDPIRYYQSGPWIDFIPLVDGVTTMTRALLLTPFKGRLLAFSTTEGGNVFQQRCRFSQSALVGAPTDDVTGWRSDIPGRGGFIDAPTSEAIISVQNLKDRLIIYFENSTWELVYTGNETLPFYFRQINVELGSESTFSIIPFDKGILGIGNVGIHACNGVNVDRIDDIIHQEVYKIQNANDGPQRVSGIRDYVEQLVYWSYPEFGAYDEGNTNQVFPNRVFLYNYDENTWANLEESFTCYGYFQRATDYTWATLPYATWSDWNTPWDGGLAQSRVLQVLAGNQQGFTMLLNNDNAANAVTRTIRSFPASNQIESKDHNMVENEYFTISTANGVTLANTLPVAISPSIYSFRVTRVLNADTFEFDGTVTGTYLGGGQITVLSNLEIASKEFNDFMPMAQSMRLNYADFLFNRTGSGAVSVSFFMNDNQISSNDPLMGTRAMPTAPDIDLAPIQVQQDTIFYRKYANAVGQFIQYNITLSVDGEETIPQMRIPQVAQSDFVLNAVVLTVEPSGRLAPL